LQDPDWRTRSAAVSCLTRCPKSALPALVQACAVEKETSIIQDQVLRFLMERDDPSSIEAILHLAARKDGVWVRFALIHKDTKKYFPKVLAIDCNHDSILKKTIAEMPKAPATLDEAMTGLSVRLKVNDRAVQWRAAYSVRRIANYFQNHPSPAFLPGLEAADYALEKLKPALLDKDPAVRRNAVFLLWQLDSMQTDFWHMFRGRKYVEITKQVEATGETIRALLNTARGDPELAIRRLARSKIRSEALPADFK
jgi:HEAT repeat protein